MSFFGTAIEFIRAALGPMGPLLVAGLFGLVLILISLPLAMRKGPDPFEKLGRQGRVAGFAGAGAREGSDQPRLNLNYNSGGMSLDRFEPYLTPQNAEEFSAMRKRLMQAGYRSKSAVGNYNFLRLTLALLGLIGGLLFTLLRGTPPTAATMALFILVPGLIGYYAPNYWVERRVQQRKEDIESGFPDTLDLMLVCIEAGQSMDQAILRVSQEIRHSNIPLAEEFEAVANEIRAGKDRATVLRDLADRCGVNDIASFVTVLVQSATFGTSIAEALRVYAAEMRDKRIMKAEEKANKLPTKLTLGTMMFTVPPLLIILVGPSIYDIYVNLLGGG